MNGVQTRFKCKLDVKRCKRFVFPPSSLLPRSNALKTKAIRYFQTDRTLTRIVSPPLDRDYLYHFAWTGEELFKSHFMVKQYGELRQVIRQVGVPGEVHGYIRHKREECLKELVSGSIRRRSTDDISNLAHTYRLECMQRLVKDYTGFERLLSMKAPREEVKAKTELETMKKKSNGLKM